LQEYQYRECWQERRSPLLIPPRVARASSLLEASGRFLTIWLQIFEQAFAAALASVAALAIAAKAAGRVEQVGAVYPNHPALSCAATCKATLMLSLQTQAAKP